MKHLIETADLNSLGNAKYDRLILDSTKNEIVYRGGIINANGHSYVDLGLPSRLKWAKCNVGAASETEYGDYFMWGSTKPNTADEFSWANAPFNGGAETFDEDYFTAHKSEWLDDNDNLKPEYETATQIMGGDWRMPTETEFQELLSGTTNEWITINGVNGRKFTGSNGNSIFIPAAGFRINGSVLNVGYYGSVWSSSLYASNPSSAWSLNFDSDGNRGMNGSNRYLGRSVRGVRK